MRVGFRKRVDHDFWTHLKRNNDLTGSHDRISSNNSSGKYRLWLELNLNLDLLDLRPHLHPHVEYLRPHLHFELIELDIIVDWLLLVFDWNPYSVSLIYTPLLLPSPFGTRYFYLHTFLFLFFLRKFFHVDLAVWWS